MDFWKSDKSEGPGATALLTGLQESTNSPNLSINSVDNSSDSIIGDHQIDATKTKPSKSSLLAKKRLQSYSAVKLKLENSKEEKDVSSPLNKATAKPVFQKVKKTVCPDDVAKGVIREIEQLKKLGYGYGPRVPLPRDIVIPEESITHQIQDGISSADSEKSDLDDDSNTFKKREIKCKSIRKNKSYKKSSPSPNRKNEISESFSKEYPKDWTEYKQYGLNVEKDAFMKLKLFKRPEEERFEFKKFFNFESPSPLIKSYKTSCRNGKSLWVPFSHLRCTATKPCILYSCNSSDNSSPAYLTKEQIFALVPRDRQLVIEKLGNVSKCECEDKPMTTRKWYPKNWRKFENVEGKLLEKSVGLSFLQSYSDEEDDVLAEKNRRNRNELEKTEQEEKVEIASEVELEEKLTPSGTPKLVSNLIELSHIKETKPKKTKLSEQDDENNTPPLEEKEEGELSEEELALNKEKTVKAAEVDEYKKDKELDVLLKPTLEENKVFDKLEKKEKKKRKKVRGDKLSKKLSKKSANKKKKAKENVLSRSSSGSEDESRSKKQKRKRKNSKSKSEKERKHKGKSEKLKKKKSKTDSGSEDEEKPSKKKKKKKKNSSDGAKKTRTIIECSESKPVIEMVEGEENYEDDIKFFAERFDAESQLIGNYKHKSKTIIALEDLSVPPVLKEAEDKEKPLEEKEIKVDLLKMNEDYLREQRKKEEEVKELVVEEGETIICEKKEELKDLEDKSAKDDEISNIEAKNENIKAKEVNELANQHPDWDMLKEKRKRNLSEDVISQKDNKKSIQETVKIDLFESPILPIKTEIVEIDSAKQYPKSNSWDIKEDPSISDKLLNLDIPLNFKPFFRNNVKVEKDYFDIEEPEKPTAPLSDIIEPVSLTPKKAKQTDSPTKSPSKKLHQKAKRNKEFDCFDIETLPLKKRRWDSAIESSASRVKLEKAGEGIGLETNNCIALENEYEQFLKAVTEKDGSDTISESSQATATDTIQSIEITAEKPLSKQEQIKPAPVPSPKLETILDLNKPLINLSVSANLTQNITLSLATSPTSISAPITSSIDLSKTSLEITAPVSMTGMALPLNETILEKRDEPKLVFTALTLPSKKLLDSSKLNLDDSDSDEKETVEEIKRKKFESLIEDNKKELIAKTKDAAKGGKRAELSPRRSGKLETVKRSRESPGRKKDQDKKRRSSSPRRKSSPRRSPRRRSPNRRRRSSSPRRRRTSLSPKRRRSPSPRRRRSKSPARGRQHQTPSPKTKRSKKSKERQHSEKKRESSPLKRSIADSTISDDQLTTQSNRNGGDDSPERLPLDIRINQVLGMDDDQRSHDNSSGYQPEQEQYHYDYNMSTRNIPQSTYRQVGNMLQIVPTDDIGNFQPEPHMEYYQPTYGVRANLMHPTAVEVRPNILQVGNMIQIVPTDTIPADLMPNPEQREVKTEIFDNNLPVPERPSSAEAAMLLKVAERRAEREKRHLEREKRRKEKERRRKEKEKKRQAKLKIKTENMIKRALELEDEEDETGQLVSQPVQWPPLSTIASHLTFKEAGKSILLNGNEIKNAEQSLPEERKSKIVQFADGVRPGEGTSPSAGEELSSPPPPKKKLPKEKRFKKTKFTKKSGKKKVKVKIIKKQPSPSESDSEDNLPPPSPPPGSPPPHVFPPRVKVKAVNNVPGPYLASIIQSAQHQQQQQYQHGAPQQPQFQAGLFRPPMIMGHPPLPQSHLQSAHIQSPRISPQTAFRSGLAVPPPPPTSSSSRSSGHSRHY